VTQPTRWSLVSLAAIVLWVAGACMSTLTEVTVNPEISELGANTGALLVRPRLNRIFRCEPIEPSGCEQPDDRGNPIPGALWVRAMPADWQYQFPRRARLPVKVWTSDGDSGDLVLRGPEGPCVDRFVACGRFDLVLNGVDDAYRLAPDLEDISARFEQILIEADSTASSIVLLLEGDLDAAIQQAQQWPGVLAARFHGLVLLAVVGAGRKGFEGGLPVELSAAVPGDGKVQVGASSTITVEYRQADGTVLTFVGTVSF
jgi:hypothetical protein